MAHAPSSAGLYLLLSQRGRLVPTLAGPELPVHPEMQLKPISASELELSERPHLLSVETGTGFPPGAPEHTAPPPDKPPEGSSTLISLVPSTRPGTQQVFHEHLLD